MTRLVFFNKKLQFNVKYTRKKILIFYFFEINLCRFDLIIRRINNDIINHLCGNDFYSN